MKHLITTCCTLFVLITLTAQNTIKLSDFDYLKDTSWKGTLTYMDYQSGELVTIDTTMQLDIENDKIVSNIQYTYEPNKNNRSTVKIKQTGTYFGSEKVVSFNNDNGTITLVTTYQGKDNGKNADMYITRTMTSSTYTVSKKVVYKDTKEELIRNRYSYTKI